jgi:hypothetical protein
MIEAVKAPGGLDDKLLGLRKTAPGKWGGPKGREVYRVP